MNKLVLTAIACAIGATACTQPRQPTDAQLATLLHIDRAAATDAKALLDTNAIECLRGWSGDADLLKGLAIHFAGEDGKKECRVRLDQWVSDSTRNPDKFSFDDISAPKTVRQAIALQAARAAAAMADQAARPIPNALSPAPMPQAPRVEDSTIDLGAPGAQLKEAETLCQQVQQAATAADANPKLAGYAKFCGGNLSKLRGTMEQAARNGGGNERLEALVASANNMANTARKLLGSGK
ncbi:MAG: hypothetical protein ABIW82_15240 [Dokdonella sp.]